MFRGTSRRPLLHRSRPGLPMRRRLLTNGAAGVAGMALLPVTGCDLLSTDPVDSPDARDGVAPEAKEAPALTELAEPATCHRWPSDCRRNHWSSSRWRAPADTAAP